jgi:hypothetical protein
VCACACALIAPLQFFVDENLNSCFGACLFMCYDFVRSDVVLELSWRHGILDFSMPYFVQFIREYVGKVSSLLSGQSGSAPVLLIAWHRPNARPSPGAMKRHSLISYADAATRVTRACVPLAV